MSQILRNQTPPDFCEHERVPCEFCQKTIIGGHNSKWEAVLIHTAPMCPEFEMCDTPKEFAMLADLKRKHDTGQRDSIN